MKLSEKFIKQNLFNEDLSLKADQLKLLIIGGAVQWAQTT